MEVDFAAPLGYVEPERKPSTSSRTLLGTTDTLIQHTATDDALFTPFKGSGQRLNGKDVVIENSDEARAGGNSTAALRLPPGLIFLGYPVKPIPGAALAEGSSSSTFAGTGQTLRASRNSKGPSIDK